MIIMMEDGSANDDLPMQDQRNGRGPPSVHVALVDASGLRRDREVMMGEDKLKLRCPQGHKVSP